MLNINIPGYGDLSFKHIVCDYNGTLACDGMLLPGVAEMIRKVSVNLEVHVVTADTFGIAQQSLSGLPVNLTILPQGNEDKAKCNYVANLNPDTVAALGNGRNDRLMLRKAVVGICLLQAEGTSAETLCDADIICRSAKEALELFDNPKRLIATLRR